MTTETLGAHLRNLLSPYKTLLNLVDDVVNGKMDIEVEDNVLSSNQQDKSLLYYERFKNYIKE